MQKRERDPNDPLEPPMNSGRFGGLSGGTLPMVAISAVVSIVVMLGMGFVGGGFFITKQDFTKNLANVSASVAAAQADAANSKNSVATAVQSIPNTVSTYVNNAVAQSTSQWNSQLSSMSDRVTSMNTVVQPLAGRISDLDTRVTSDVNALNTKVADLTTRVATLETKSSDHTTRIKALEDKLATTTTTSTGSTSASGVTITVTPLQSNPVYTNMQYGYSLTISNTTSTLKRVYIQALLTPSSSYPNQTLSTVSAATFTASGGSITDGTFTTIYTPSNGVNCIRILSTSNGYIPAIGTGSITVIVTFTYSASPLYMWDIAFSPIVVAY